ncbi:MAG: hypothetical protein HRU01_17735 [Myxococcales bacterium]|nr:hypothetical protein [Myxococcales bacterium]
MKIAINAAREYIRTEGPARVLTARRPAAGGTAGRDDACWVQVASDVALFDFLLDDRPAWVSAVGSLAEDVTEVESIHVTLHYRCGTIAQIELGAPGVEGTGRVALQVAGRQFVLADAGDGCELLVDAACRAVRPVTGPAEPFRTFANESEHLAAALAAAKLPAAHGVDLVRSSLRAGGGVVHAS